MPIHKRPVRIPSQQAKPVEPTAPSQPGQVKAADHSDIGKWWESLSPEDKKKAAANVPKPEGNGIRARWHEKFTSNPESAAWHDSTMTSLIAQAHDMSDGLADGKGPIDASSTTTGQAASTAPSSAESKDLYPSERWGGVKGQQSGEPKKYTFPESGQVTAKNLTMPLNFPAAGEKSVEHTGPNGQKVRAWTGPSGYRYVGVKSGNLPEAKFEAPPEGGPNSDKFSRIMPGSDGPVKHKRDAEFRPVEDTKEPDNKGFNPPEPVSPEIEQMNAAKSYAAQLHGHWMGQMHEDPETVANHMRHYQSAMDEINKLPEGVKRAVLSHAKSMSGGWDHQNPSSSKPSGHRLKFSSPPSGDVLNKLKQAGFVYDPKTRQWHGTKHEMKLLGGVPRGATDFGGADPAHLKKSRNFDASSADYNPDIAKPATPPPLPVDRQLEAARKHVAKHFNDVKSIDRELKLIRQGKDMAYDSAMNDGGKSIKAAETMEQALQEHRDKLSQQSESPPGGKSPKAPAPGSGASLKALVAELNPQGGMASGHQQARAKAEAFVRDQLQPLPKDQVYRAMQEAGIEGVRPGDSKEAMLHRAQASILAGVRAWERTQA